MTSFLLDTSAWILSFSPSCPARLKSTLDDALKEDQVQTCGVVVAELLQGCRGAKERRALKGNLGALPYLNWNEEDWILLGETASDLRSRGCAVPIADLIVGLLAIRHSATVLHRDKHFDLMAKHLSLSAEKV